MGTSPISSTLYCCLITESGTDGVSVHPGIEPVLPGGLCGGRAGAVCSKHGILSACCCWIPAAAAAYHTVRILYSEVLWTTLAQHGCSL